VSTRTGRGHCRCVRFAARWRSEVRGIPTREWTESLLVVAAMRAPSARLPSRLCWSRCPW